MFAGDFNAKIGKEIEAYGPAIGKESLHENCNENGIRLVSFCIANNLMIGGTFFPHKTIHKHTWKSPDNRTYNQIDHILISRKHRSTLQDVRSLRSLDCNTDHYLIRAKIKAKLCTKKSLPTEKRKTYDVEKLKDNAIRNTFQLKLDNRFQILDMIEEETEPDTANEQWQTLADTIKEIGEEEVGLVQRRRRNA